MNIFNLFMILTLSSAAANVFIFILITCYLSKHGIKFNLLEWRLMLPVLNRYKQIISEELGAPGSMYKYWLVTINMALVFVVLMIIGAK